MLVQVGIVGLCVAGVAGIWTVTAGWSAAVSWGALFSLCIGLLSVLPSVFRTPTDALRASVVAFIGFSVRLFGLLFAFLFARSNHIPPKSMLLFCAVVLVLVTLVDAVRYWYGVFHPRESVSV